MFFTGRVGITAIGDTYFTCLWSLGVSESLDMGEGEDGGSELITEVGQGLVVEITEGDRRGEFVGILVHSYGHFEGYGIGYWEGVELVGGHFVSPYEGVCFDYTVFWGNWSHDNGAEAYRAIRNR